MFAAPRVFIVNTSFNRLVGGSTSVHIGRESGCEEFPCNSSHGSSCSYRNFSLLCTPCAVDFYSLDGRTCTACSHGQHASQDQRSCTDDREPAIDCAGEWSACSSDCRREWTQTAAPSGTGAACPVEPRCAAGEGDCQSSATIVLELVFIVSALIFAAHTSTSVASRGRSELSYSLVTAMIPWNWTPLSKQMCQINLPLVGTLRLRKLPARMA